MATNAQLSVPDQIRQLEGARKLVLGDTSYYPQVIQATLPIIGPSAQVEFRRWGAEFLSEAFATPAVPLSQKETLCLLVLETLKNLVEDPNQDFLVLRSVIQTAASIYPLGFRWIINNSYDTATWERMVAIKSRILQLWDTAPPTVRICCIKFAQRVVLAQTPSVNQEPRRGDPLDISINMIPPSHPVLATPTLEAEASGLLDRMLAVLQENSSETLIVDSTLNSLSILIRGRPVTSNRILTAVLNFNPFTLATAAMTPKTKVLIKSMEKTVRMLLIHLARRDPNNPQAHRIQQAIERLMRSRAEVFDDGARKRALEQASETDAKRQRLAVASQADLEIKPLGPGPHTLADVFTLTSNEGLKRFDASVVPAPLAAKIAVNTIMRIDAELMERAIKAVRDRFAALHEAQQQPMNPETALLGVEEDDDDYEPDYYAAEDTEQILNKLDSAGEDREMQKMAALGSLTLPTFKLPPPPALNPEQAAKVGQGTVQRVLSTMRSLEDPATKKTKGGFNRLAASSYDRDSWITVLTRLATRANFGLDDVSIKHEDGALALPSVTLSNTIRESLYGYVLEDFRKRIDVAVSWLSEEWYNDQMQQRNPSPSATAHDVPLNYGKWVLRLVDGMLPYLHGQDKILTRFLSELPELNAAILARVKTLCRDPSMVQLVLQSLLYLVMMRPPVREIALDTVQDVWTEYEDARPIAAKYLTRYRPGFLEAATKQADGGAPPAAGGAAIAT